MKCPNCGTVMNYTDADYGFGRVKGYQCPNCAHWESTLGSKKTMTVQEQIDEIVNHVASLYWLTADTTNEGTNRAKNFREKMRTVKGKTISSGNVMTELILDRFVGIVLANELEYLLEHAPTPSNWSMSASKALLERLRNDEQKKVKP